MIRLRDRTILPANLLRAIAAVSFVSALSCSHFSSPPYVPQGEYAAGGEYSPKASTARPRQGPFRLQWPVRKMELTRGFGGNGRKPHHGLDIKGRKGDPIFAAHDGIVVYAGRGFRGYGNMILLEYDNEWASLYAHLSRIRVKTGQTVEAGTRIGDMGRTGRASGVHLHFELLKNKIPIDPLSLFDTPHTAAWIRLFDRPGDS